MTLDVQARKVVHTAGAETGVPMNLQIGVFARGAPLYVRMHRIPQAGSASPSSIRATR
ncbi:MAG TPA: hypothetical protein VF647_07240 [Longimicrobium sp.]